MDEKKRYEEALMSLAAAKQEREAAAKTLFEANAIALGVMPEHLDALHLRETEHVSQEVCHVIHEKDILVIDLISYNFGERSMANILHLFHQGRHYKRYCPWYSQYPEQKRGPLVSIVSVESEGKAEKTRYTIKCFKVARSGEEKLERSEILRLQKGGETPDEIKLTEVDWDDFPFSFH